MNRWVWMFGGLFMAALVPQFSAAAAFTAGNVVVYRVGDGSAVLGSPATAAFLDEYSPTGTLVQSVALPTAVSGANFQCTNSGTATTEGLMTTSADGAYLVGGCYAAALGLASITTSSPAATARVIFRADSTGAINTTTALTDAASGGNPRGAASTNGTDLWAISSTNGVRYFPLGATSSTQLSTTATNLRGVSVYGGQLYVSSGAGTIRLATAGTGTPTTSGQLLTQLNGIPTATITNNAFVLLDMSATVAGVDTAYVADESAGIVKYSFDGTIWTAKGTVGAATDIYRGVTATTSGGNVVLYAIRKANELVTITDSSGATGTFSGTPTSLAVTGTANKAFRSVAFAPVNATPPPTPTLSVVAPTITEGDSGTQNATLTVNLDNPAPAGGVTFQIDTVDGTATAGSDYVAIVAGTGSIAAGASSTTFNVVINGDTVYEGDENFTVNLSQITHTTNTTASTLATITENDPLPTISVGDASLIEGNSGTSVMIFPVTLSNASTSDVQFTAQTVNGTATAGSDYDALTTTVTISAGMTTASIFVGIHGDTSNEPNETFTLALSNQVNATLGNLTATGTILNDDNVTPTISINNVTKAEGNSGTSNFTFTVSSNVIAPVGGYTLNVDTADGTATEADNDYVGAHTTVTIAQGATSAPFSVVVNGDNKTEADETFSVTLSNPTGGATIGTGVGIGTITNDDALPTLSIASVSVNEGNSGTSNATFTPTLSNPSSTDVTFNIDTVDGTALAGSDYVAIAGASGTIAAGTTSTTINVVINGDTTIEANETFTLNLSTISGTTNATASATGTILNDDNTTIMQINGHGVTSPLKGQTLTIGGGVVTATDAKGFFMQDPIGDGDITTSDGIYVFLNHAPTVAVGHLVTVRGKVDQFDNYEIEIDGTVTVTDNGLGTMPTPYNLNSSPPTDDYTTGVCANAMITPLTDGYAATNFACLNDMLVSFNGATVVGAVGGSSPANLSGSEAGGGNTPDVPKFFYLTLAPTRELREPGIIPGDPALTNPVFPTYMPNYQGPLFSGHPNIFQVFYDALAGFSTSAMPDAGYGHGIYNVGQTVSITRGVLQQFAFTTKIGTTFYPDSPVGYEIYPLTGADVTVSGAGLTLPQAVTDPVPGTLTIGSQNGLHFFNNVNDGSDSSAYIDACLATEAGVNISGNVGGSSAGGLGIPLEPGDNDTCPTQQQYDTRLSKMSLQIRDVLKAPSVQVLQETENLSVLGDIVGKIHSDSVANDDHPVLSYRPFLFEGNDPQGINIGILVKDDGEVVVNSVSQLGLNTTTSACSGGGSCLQNDRPPVLLDASYNGSPFRVLAIYDRSLSSLSTSTYVGPKRRAQAEQVARIVQALQTDGSTLISGSTGDGCSNRVDGTGASASCSDIAGSSTIPVIVIGDFNANEFSDGYVDVTGTIAGTVDTNATHSIFPPTAGYVKPSPTLFNTVESTTDPATNPLTWNPNYSYSFDGLSEEIDHVLLTRAGWADFLSISHAHGNSDVSSASPDVSDPTTPRRLSDHDGQVLTLAIDRIFADGFEAQP